MALATSLLASLPMQASAVTDYVGKENEGADLKISLLSRYDSGTQDGDGGTVEIVSYNQTEKVAYVINGKTGMLTRVDLSNVSSEESLTSTKDIDVKALVTSTNPSFSYGDMTSVDYSDATGYIAVAIQDSDHDKNGYVAFFKDNGSGLEIIETVEVGVQPDMVTFNPEGTMVLTANEGEPRQGYEVGTVDPMGSVSIIDAGTFQGQTLDFTSFDGKRDELVEKGVILKKNTNPSVDLEPEYIDVAGNYAFVSLQEANAIATIDLSRKEIVDISGVGFIDHGLTPIDIDKSDKKYIPKTYSNLYGISMPDGIKVVELNGEIYILTSNEGDGREWGSGDNEYVNEIKGKKSPTGNIKTEKKVTYFDPADYDGVDSNKDYLFGGRSFSMLKWDGKSLTSVFNSGADFEALTAKYYPEFFNVSNDNIDIEDRSGKKGPEPESVTVGQVEGKTYAFVTLERISGVMVYDISDPAQVKYVNYINSRDFSGGIKDDVSPEGLKFVPAQSSPTGKALLLAAMEVSGTLAVYELEGEPVLPPVEPEEPTQPVEPIEPVVPVEPTIPIGPFFPLPPADPVDPVKPVEEGKLVEAYIFGYPDGNFLPQANVSRGEAATLFARLLILDGVQKPTDGSSVDYADIKDHWAEKDIDFISQLGYIHGYKDGQFKPDEKITRAEFAKMIQKYSKKNDTKAPFKDIENHWAQEAIHQAYGNGIIKGYEDNTFRPNNAITRAETVKMLNALFQRETKANDIKEIKNLNVLKTFPDVEKDFWAFFDILDGTNSHTENKNQDWIELK